MLEECKGSKVENNNRGLHVGVRRHRFNGTHAVDLINVHYSINNNLYIASYGLQVFATTGFL